MRIEQRARRRRKMIARAAARLAGGGDIGDRDSTPKPDDFRQFSAKIVAALAIGIEII